jgi:hypothetical protein
MGNLLLDVQNNSGADSAVGQDYFDAVSGDPTTSRVFGPEGSPTATSGTADGLGLITQFQFSPAVTAAPEPASLTLLGLGVASLGLRAWRRKSAV